MTGQYFVADSSIERRIAASDKSRARHLVDEVDLGEDLRVLVTLAARGVDRGSDSIAWRFLRAIEMMSIAVHDASAARTVSTGLPPCVRVAIVELEIVAGARSGAEMHPAECSSVGGLVGRQARQSTSAGVDVVGSRAPSGTARGTAGRTGRLRARSSACVPRSTIRPRS